MMRWAKWAVFACLASQAIPAAASAHKSTPSPAAVSVTTGTKQSSPGLRKIGRGQTTRTLDRVAYAVDGAESGHGMDLTMWRPNWSGPQGPMQVSEGAAIDVGGGDRFDPLQNRLIGRAYLEALYTRYRNWPDAIAAYNWGLSNVDSWIRAGRPTEKFLPGVAAYTMRVLRDSGLCDDAATAAPFTHPLFARSEADAPIGNRHYGCADMPSGSLQAWPLRSKRRPSLVPSLFEGKAAFARSSWGTAMRRLGCTISSADSVQCN